MLKRLAYAAASLLVVVLLTAASPQAGNESSTMESDTQLIYRVTARMPRVNREVLDEVTDEVQGVPAEPVDSFVWDGVGSEPTVGHAVVDIDPVNNTGTIRANWIDEHGSWTFKQTGFFAPDHASGLKVGPGAGDTQLVNGDPIPLNVYLHGDTTAGGPVLPTIFNLMATWGLAEVTLNGELLENTYDGPTPNWVAHTMLTEGVRNEDGTVRTVDGEIFNPLEDPTNGAVDPDDLEFHLVFHDAPGPGMTDNFPPPFAFFYHLTFEDVQVSIKHR
jgi:hypothetical protein